MPAILNLFRRVGWPIGCLLLAFLFLNMTRKQYRSLVLPECTVDTVQPYSLAEWKKMDSLIKEKRDSMNGGPGKRIPGLTEVRILDSVLDNLKNLENSPQKYSIFPVDEHGIGETAYYIDSDIIVFNVHVNDVANFIHETTHGGQFQLGEIVFRRVPRKTNDTSRGTGDDFNNELEAYRAQFAYDRSSVSNLNNSKKMARSLEDLDVIWLLGLYGNAKDRRFIYTPNRSSGVVALPINYCSNLRMMRAVYPDNPHWIDRPDSTYYRLGNDTFFFNFPAKINKKCPIP